MTSFNTSSKLNYVRFEMEAPNGDTYVGEWDSPNFGIMSVSHFDSYAIGYQLEWSGNGTLTHVKKPIDIDDNPCIVRGYD